MPWNYLEKIINDGTQEPYSKDLVEAKSEYHKTAGEIYEDDKAYETRMALFLEWYLFDRILAGTETTQLDRLIELNQSIWDEDYLEACKGFTGNIFGIFIVKKIRDKEVTVLNLFDAMTYTVKEQDGKMMFDKNDIFQARLLPYQDALYFTRNFCFHPRDARKFIENEIRDAIKEQTASKSEIKKLNSSIETLHKRLKKNREKLEKFRNKIESVSNEAKRAKLIVEEQNMLGACAQLEQEIGSFEYKKERIEIEKIKIEGRTVNCQLAHRLGYMQLKWERSRQIDLKDIYTS
ncbi:MAG: hypothetical protein G3M78_11610 [Candidatus Nitrohelix vancouverensis]|uniref:Uncharacterized protein n=1 Tax=Candidatus Nitrohelix vancouverensis TaxID=2705534 RepID=A0A7T0G416_9BACT|nr:MAG: hypothetical protein G3M78_11610 [Candidatus Nitrohelix vancouverensis]